MHDLEWFDLWCERYEQLMDEEDFAGLVQCCRERLERDPDDAHAVEALAEAYVLNNQNQDSIDMLTPYYMKDPEHPLYAHAILDALLAMGRKVEDFPWKSQPKLLELTKDTLDACYSHLKPKRRPRAVFDLHFMFMGDAYILFSEEELLNALASDERFIVSHEGGVAEISVARKRCK